MKGARIGGSRRYSNRQGDDQALENSERKLMKDVDERLKVLI